MFELTASISGYLEFSNVNRQLQFLEHIATRKDWLGRWWRGRKGLIWAQSYHWEGEGQGDTGERQRDTGDRHQSNQTGETRRADHRAESEEHIFNQTAVRLSVWTSSFPPASRFLSERRH